MENTETRSSGPSEDVDSILNAMMFEQQKFAQKDPDARTNLISQARCLIATLETRMEYIFQMIWANPTTYLAIRLALDLKIFETLATDAGRRKTVAELSAPTGADPNLIARIARHLSATAVICEPEAARYGPSALSQALTIPKYAGGIKFCLYSNALLLCQELVAEFRVKIPQWKGRLVLQEQEAVVKKVSDLDARIEVMAHDFFKPQPVRGARAYYFRNVLHDWPDERCRDILRQLKNAMKHGYSKILLDENVVADHGAS